MRPYRPFAYLIFSFLILSGIINCRTGAGPSNLVDPMIGTGGHGHTYPGAARPFGMVQLSPDTRLTGWDGCSGYHYSDSVIFGFSHTHLSGTGISDYGDILLMPTVGEVRIQNGSPEDPDSGYASRFSHENEQARPGYYRVRLDDYGIDAELTVTPRVGFHRYDFHAQEKPHVIVDLKHRDRVIESYLRIVGDSEIEGMRRSRQWAENQVVYFTARFSQPFKNYGIAVNEEIHEGLSEASGTSLKAHLDFDPQKSSPLLVKVGISAVDIAGARKNLEAEIPHWDFERIRRDAQAEWDQSLGNIRIKGGTRDQQTIFYTALYHSLLNPNLYTDVDGRFRGTDLGVHTAKDFTNYTVFSLWDTFRAAHPLLTLIEPDRTRDFLKTFLAQYRIGGHLPVWELAGNETWCMIGNHAISVIADAVSKGIRDFDTKTALGAMKHSAEQDHFGLEYYKKYGFIPAESEAESVSRTLEYAYDDWCIAQTAKELGLEEDYIIYLRRALNYRNVFDPDTGFMRARMNAAWFSPFDPREVNFNYTEANSWQYSFFVPHDISGLMEMMGGEKAFEEKLDALFTADSQTTGRDQADITGLIGQYAHGNEPSHHVAYLYNYAGSPWKTQQRVREIMEMLYTAAPDGISGNEDCGQMSAWYVFSALGFYPVTPGQPIYAVGSPLFPRAEIMLQNGKTFRITARGISPKNIFLQSAALNGTVYTKSFLRHQDLLAGGELELVMGPKPNREWGESPKDRPESKISDVRSLPAPFVKSGERAFQESQLVELGCVTGGADIFYTLDGSDPDETKTRYSGPLKIDRTTTLKARAYKQGFSAGKEISAKFHKAPAGLSIKLFSQFSPQYSAGGEKALIDGIRGGDNFRTGTWQGYHGVNLEAVVDLGKNRTIQRPAAGFLQDTGSWIFLPTQVEFLLSETGDIFRRIALIKNEQENLEEGVLIREFGAKISPVQGRYVKIIATGLGICPEWHPGAGEKAWIFADEIIIE